jgi:hypothetical protein
MTSPPIANLPVAKIKIDVVESPRDVLRVECTEWTGVHSGEASSLEGLEAVSRD